MSLQLTPEGAHAYAMLARAQADHGQIPLARRQLAGLARAASGRALAEIRDAGTMLERLAGSLDLAAAGQAVELRGRWTGWEHEPRAPDGRWMRGGGTGLLERPEGRVEHDRALVADARTASPEEYSRAFEKAFRGSPFSAFVTHYTPDQIRAGHMTPVLAAGGKAGVLIHDHGDGRVEATALFNTSGKPGMGLALARLGIERYGANYAECYGPVLPEMYKTLGFADTDVYPFDRSLAAADWDGERFDSPDYHLMGLQPAVGTAAEDEGLDLDVIRRAAQADPAFTEDAWQAALAVFGVTSPRPAE